MSAAQHSAPGLDLALFDNLSDNEANRRFLASQAPAMLAELQQLRAQLATANSNLALAAKITADVCAQRDRLAGALAETSNQLTELLCSRQLDSTLPPFYSVRESRDTLRAALANARKVMEGGQG